MRGDQGMLLCRRHALAVPLEQGRQSGAGAFRQGRLVVADLTCPVCMKELEEEAMSEELEPFYP